MSRDDEEEEPQSQGHSGICDVASLTAQQGTEVVNQPQCD